MDCIVDSRSADTPNAIWGVTCRNTYLDVRGGLSHRQSYTSNMGHLRAFFILCIVFPSGFQTCVATNAPLNSIVPTELVNSTSVSNISSIAEMTNVFTLCSASVASWLGFEKPVPNTFIGNCIAADEMLQADINKYGSTRLEFVPRRKSGTHGLEVTRTPIKYTAGTRFSQ